MTVKKLIEILQTMPQDAIVVSDDGTGWLAQVTEEGVSKTEIVEKDIVWVQIIGDGDSV